MHPNQKQALDQAVRVILKAPEANSLKSGDISTLRVYKYKLHGAQQLFGYSYDATHQVVNLVSVAPHENFYRDIKR